MISVIEYYRIPGGALSLEEIDGYEWAIITVKGVNKNPNIFNLGAAHWWRKEDCYGALDNLTDDSYYGATNAGDDIWKFTAEWQGKTYDQCLLTEDSWIEDNRETKTRVIYHEFFLRIPIGYDGIYVGVINIANIPDDIIESSTIQDLANDDSLFFRLD